MAVVTTMFASGVIVVTNVTVPFPHRPGRYWREQDCEAWRRVPLALWLIGKWTRTAGQYLHRERR